jgi:hypothetical protein
MDFHKKILIAIIIIILTYVLWRLLKRRAELKSKIENFDLSSITNTIGSYVPTIATSVPNQDDEFKSLKDTTYSTKVKNINPSIASMPLKEYCIKGSYNSAYTGNYINLEMVSYVLSRGCRFLDFEVFYINENNLTIPKVGVSIDPNYNTLMSNNSILLDNVLTTAVGGAFSSTSPNNQDPLFINLRIKSNNNEVYHAVAKSIDYALKSKLFNGKITDSTTLGEVMGQVVIVIDKTINRNYLDYAICETMDNTCYDLTNYINMESGSQLMNLIHYSELTNQCAIPINIADNNDQTDIKRIKLLMPDTITNQKSNVYYNPLVYKYGCQIVPYIYYYKDAELSNYEKFFNDNQSAIVPLSIALPYFQKLSQSQIQSVNL